MAVILKKEFFVISNTPKIANKEVKFYKSHHSKKLRSFRQSNIKNKVM